MTHLTRRTALAATLATLAPLPLWAQDAETREVETMAIGDPDAPITVIEYASLTCPHCARFHADVYPRLKQNYIETGKVRFEVREVYFDRLGLWSAMVARCGGQDRYFGIIDRLYARQAEWSRQSNVQDAMTGILSIGRQAGLTDEDMQACLQDQGFAEALVARFQETTAEHDIDATPTFIVDGEKMSNMSYDAFARILDDRLGS